MNIDTLGAEVSFSGAELAALLGDVLRKGASFRFKAKGSSMSPFIRDGDVLTVSIPGNPGLGDVVAFQRPENGRLVIHRVIANRRGSLLIKGDHASEPDGRIPRSGVAGRITKVERNGKNIRLGLGPERRLIAFLSRNAILAPMVNAARTFRR